MRPAASPHHHAFPSVAALNPPVHAAVLVADRVELIDFAEPDSADALMALELHEALNRPERRGARVLVDGSRASDGDEQPAAERGKILLRLCAMPRREAEMGPGTGF